MSPRTTGKLGSPKRIRLRPQDPFDLIRLLARSQSDPRKAVGELVQNSLDAGASTVEIEWFNHEGRRALRIWDDGEGVFPELEREAALRTIARTIGHSHKRDLTPTQRREEMVLGQYGIGLIGFWSVGETLEMKSRVAEGKPFVLRLREDRATGEVFPSRSRKVGDAATFTEITVRKIHASVVNRIRPARLQAYLANELRGQLLDRGATVRIRDRVARGRARKLFLVEPRPYLGLPLDSWNELAVPGFESARVELYLVAPDENRRGVVSLSCGGTVVLDDIAEIDGIDVPREPWSSGALEGVIDFPELHVAPGSRRGFSHGEPVAAFVAELEKLEHKIVERMALETERRAEERREDLSRQIRKAFRSVARNLGDYDFFGVRGAGGSAGDGASSANDASTDADTPGDVSGNVPRDAAFEAEAPIAAGIPEGEPLGPAPAPKRSSNAGDSSSSYSSPDADETKRDMLFPPGPLAEVALKPRTLRVPPFATRGLHARAVDADGRACTGSVTFTWQLLGPGQLKEAGPQARYTAPESGAEDHATVRVQAVQGSTKREAEARIQLVPPPGSGALLQGIPDPRPVTAPGASWRSRFREGAWEYNDAHRDYLTVADHETGRLRYLVHLLAKELVLRNFGSPGDAEVLERMVEILTHLDLGRKRVR